MPFSRDSRVIKVLAGICCRVSSTIRSPTSRACLNLADTQKGMVAEPKGARPMASANTAMVLAVPYMEQVPQEAHIFWR